MTNVTKRKKKKDAPNLRRFRTNILELVNEKYGSKDEGIEEVKDEAPESTAPKEKKVSRKQRRKDARTLKKARKLAFSQHRKLPKTIEELHKKDDQEIEKTEKRPSGAQRRKKAKAKKAKTAQQTEEKESKARIQTLRAQIAEDDKMIKQLSKQMKLNKRKRKNLPAAFGADGLDYLLDAVDSDKLKALYQDNDMASDEDDGKPSYTPKRAKSEESQSDFSGNSEDEQDEDMQVEDDDNKNDSDDVSLSDVSVELDDTDEEEAHQQESKIKSLTPVSDSDYDDDDDDDDDDGQVSDRDDGDEQDDLVDEDEESSDEHDGSNDEVREDIYGRTVDKKGNVVTAMPASSTGAYIPPAKRAAMMATEQEDVILARLDKRLKGLLNRLGEANLAGISTDIERMYRSNSRAHMNRTLLNNTKISALSTSLIPDRLLMVQTMLVAVLHANVDNEIGAYIIQSYACELDSLLTSNKVDDKQLDNVILFICYLYHFKVIHSILVLDILKRLCEEFQEKHIDLIVLILKTVGFNLRKDDALGLKELILRVQEKANAHVSTVGDQTRVRFMLDLLLAIRNNNTRKLPQYDPEAALHARKVVAQVVRNTSEAAQLRISFNDLLASETRGAWWRVGSAWSGNTEESLKDTEELSTTIATQDEDATSADLLELARKQRMNTDIRRKIFCCIMGSSDYMDCTEKLLRLGLNHRQEEEIIHVLVDCCVQEKVFNPYYSLLADKLCKTHRRFAIRCRFTIWDRMKTLSNLSSSSLTNLSKFVYELIHKGALSVALFKVSSLADLDKPTLKFTRNVILGLIQQPDAKLNEIFSKISQSTKFGQLAISLSAFIQHFIVKNVDKLKNVEPGSLLKKVSLVERVLAGENKLAL